MKIITETERLIIREILPTDVDEIFELHSDPEVHIYLGNKTITRKEKIIEGINFIRQQYIDYGVGRWAIIDKKSNEFIGWTGLEKEVYAIADCKNEGSNKIIKKIGLKSIETFDLEGVKHN